MELLNLLTWYLLTSILGWLALPVGFSLFRHLPDRGYAFSKSIGLLFIGFLLWFFGSLGFMKNDLSGICLALILLIILSGTLLQRLGFEDIKRWLSENRQLVIVEEILFLAAFTGFALLRAYNPNIEGTEKPMEFMFLNSILRSPSFPPQDAWLSNYAISYYYFGYVLIAVIASVTGTASAVAFNLGLALTFALAVMASSGVVMNLIALVKEERSTERNQPKPALLASFIPSLLGPLLIVIVGNFYGALELVHDQGLLAQTEVPAVWYDFGSAPDLSKVTSLEEMTRQPGFRAGLINLWEWLDLKQLPSTTSTRSTFSLAVPNWFFAARVVHDRNLIGVETEAIDETPSFSFLLGDLHPHLLALPFVLLAIALALEVLLTGREFAFSPTIQGVSLFLGKDRWLLSTVILGSLIFLNTWDFPIYWLLCIISLVVGIGFGGGLRRIADLWRSIVLFALALLGLSLLCYGPFFLTFQSQAGGILPNPIYPTRLQQILVMFGPVLLGASLFLIWFTHRIKPIFDRRIALVVGVGVISLLVGVLLLFGLAILRKPGMSSVINAFIYPLTIDEAGKLLLERRLIDSGTTIWGAVLIGLAAGAGIGLFRCINRKQTAALETYDLPKSQSRSFSIDGVPAVGMVLGMIMTGALLLIGPEFVYLRDLFGTRMNTIFKFYFQAWVLWGAASAFGIWYLFQYARPVIRSLTALLFLGIMLAGLVYPIGGFLSKTNSFSTAPTLDGMANFAVYHPNDWQAIQWLEKNAPPESVLLEGSQGEYWIEGPSSRFSMATGMPTLMGWAGHEQQWRGDFYTQVAARMEEIRTVYQTNDWSTAQAILDKYRVNYVIVSSWEERWYTPVSLRKFDQHLQRVYQVGDVTIYQY